MVRSLADRTFQQLRPQTSSKSALAVSLNVSLTKIDSIEELLAFATANRESLDIVNVVTAIHRSGHE